jgi:hypothetical protein
MFWIGDKVNYFGSVAAQHGTYVIVRTPSNPNKRGYVLLNHLGQTIENVSPLSIQFA